MKCNPVKCLSIINSLASSIFCKIGTNVNETSVSSSDTLPSSWIPEKSLDNTGPENSQIRCVEIVAEESFKRDKDVHKEESLGNGSDESEYFSAESKAENSVEFIKIQRRTSVIDEENGDCTDVSILIS